MTYGWRTSSNHDPKLALLFESLEKYLRLNHAGFAALADFFPILRRLPAWMMPIKGEAIELYEEQRELYLGHWYEVKKAIQNGRANPCMSVDLARLQEKEGFSDKEAAFLTGKNTENLVASFDLRADWGRQWS